MGASFTFIRSVAVTGFVSDPDPNVTDPDVVPATPKSFRLPVSAIDAPLQPCNRVAMFAEFDPVTASTMTWEIWEKDETTSHWTKNGSFGAVNNNETKFCEVTPGARAFARITALGGAAPAGGHGYLRLAPTTG